MKQKKINPTFKILSMFGIIFVVSGHLVGSSFSLLFDYFPPYSFHLALFTFISGYFFKEEDLCSFRSFLKKKARNLLVPFFIWTLIYGVFASIMHWFGFSFGTNLNLKSLLIDPLIDGHQFIYNLASWYVIPLLCIQILNFGLRLFFQKVGYKSEYKITFLYLIVGMLGITMAHNGYNTGTYLLLFRILFLLPCFQMGTLYKRKLEEKDNIPSYLYFIIVIGVQTLLLVAFQNLNYTVAWGNDFIKGPIVPYLSAITGIAFWLRVSRLLTPLLEKQRWVRVIADNTSSIMMHHILGFLVCKTFFAALARLTPFLSSFDMHAYKTDIWYYYYPRSVTAFGLVYVAFAIFFSILVKKGVDRLLEYIRNLYIFRKNVIKREE